MFDIAVEAITKFGKATRTKPGSRGKSSSKKRFNNLLINSRPKNKIRFIETSIVSYNRQLEECLQKKRAAAEITREKESVKAWHSAYVCEVDEPRTKMIRFTREVIDKDENAESGRIDRQKEVEFLKRSAPEVLSWEKIRAPTYELQ